MRTLLNESLFFKKFEQGQIIQTPQRLNVGAELLAPANNLRLMQYIHVPDVRSTLRSLLRDCKNS